MPHLLFYEAGTAPTSRSVRELASLRRHGWDITVAHGKDATDAVAALGYRSFVLPDPPGNPIYNALGVHATELSAQSQVLTARINEIVAQLKGEANAKLRNRLGVVRQRTEELSARIGTLRTARKARAEAAARRDLAAAKDERSALGEQIRAFEGGLRAELAELKTRRSALASQVRAIHAARRTPAPVTGGSKFGDLARFEARWHVHAPALATVEADVYWAADLDALPAVIWAAEAAETPPPVVYDSHELFCELEYMPDLYRAGWRELADRFIPRAAAVITVCAPIATVLDEEYGANGTHVIHNLAPGAPTGPGRLRSVTGIGPDAPLAIHVGNISHTRNPLFAVDLLGEMPELNVAFVGAPNAGVVEDLRNRAEERGVGDRLHFVPPVPLVELTGFISDADVSLIMIDGSRSRDTLYTMPNKLFDSLAASVPVVAPEACAAGDFVTAHQVGRVFKLNAAGQLAAAVRAVIDDPDLRDRIRSRTDEFLWSSAETTLFALVDGVLPKPDPA